MGSIRNGQMDRKRERKLTTCERIIHRRPTGSVTTSVATATQLDTTKTHFDEPTSQRHKEKTHMNINKTAS